jgi:hypothetical protein
MLCYSHKGGQNYTVPYGFLYKDDDEYIKEIEEALQAKLEAFTFKEKKSF